MNYVKMKLIKKNCDNMLKYFCFFFVLVQTAREEAANYRQQFKRPIPLKVLNDRISNFIHAYTLYSAVRPFGVSVILASCDPHTGPELYMIEPSGTSYVSESFDLIIIFTFEFHNKFNMVYCFN